MVSFSDGRIRAELIREKLGLVGLDKLNEFAESCAAGDFALSITLIDALLSSGVAVETFIADLAGYYHSLLLIKAGVSREAILGYPPSRFSAAVLEKYDTVRLERAGELLYALHRDIRYSVSPRFELETLASKLCWLEKWISPPELADTVAQARNVLGYPQGYPQGSPQESPRQVNETGPGPGTGGSERPRLPSEGIGRPLANPNPGKSPAENGVLKRSASGEEPRSAASAAGSLTEELNRYMAEKASTPLDSGVQKVLEVFNGTIVEENRE